jgi:anthranilate synthase/aminodeoxychorismate synthase-like glutamine amidotransferase
MIVLIDNYDSFTYNLKHRIGEQDPSLEVAVYRNDEITVGKIRSLQPSHIIISPGPCSPSEAGISVQVVEELMHEFPILGVCLGHQSMGQATGGKIVRAVDLKHGKVDEIHHEARGLFAGLPSPIVATRYHSLVIAPETLHPDFEVVAWANASDGSREIMGIQHRRLPLFGLQFHPESFLSETGPQLLARFLETSAVTS